MKKRILSLVLAFLFVFALTAPASAIVDVYHEVSITNVPIPNEGSLYPGTAGISTSHGTVKSIVWYKYSGAKAEPWDVAEEGLCQFILTVGLEEGYDWDLNYTGIKVTSRAGNNISFMDYEIIGRDLSITAWVETDSPKGTMDYVEIMPYKTEFAVVPGATPNFNGYLITNGMAGYSTRWWDGTTGKDLTETDTFVAGHTYHVSFYINPDPYAEWKEKSHGYADVEAYFINGDQKIKAQIPSLSYESSGIKLLVTYTFECTAPAPAAKEIKSVAIEANNGFWYPVHGQKPAGSDSFDLLTEGTENLWVSWQDDTTGKAVLSTDKFVGGHTYTVIFNVHILPGYKWASPEKIQVTLDDGAGNGWITQKPVEIHDTDFGYTLNAQFTFTAVKDPLPEKLIVKNIHAPVEGKPLDFTAEVTGCSSFEVTWSDSDMDVGWYEASDAPIAKKGLIYTVSVRIWPPAGSAWPFREDENHQEWLDLPFEMILSDGTRLEGAKAIYGGYDGVHPADACIVCCSFPPVGQEKPAEPQVLFMEEPKDLTVAEGQSAVFSVTIKGESKSIQWYEAKPGGAFLKLTDSADVAGSNTPKLTLKNVKAYQNGYSYRCIAADKYGLEVTSKAGTLTVTKTAIEPTASIVFSDVKESDWFYNWVYDAVKLGLINGKGKKDGKDYFDPAGNITFAETAKLAACMHQKYTTGAVTLSNGDPWYKPYADYCGENGILKKDASGGGISVGDVMTRANEAVTRAEFAWIFAHALPKGALPGINEIPDDTVPDVKHSGLAKEFWSFREEAYEEIYTLYRAGIVNGSDSRGTFNPTSTIKRSEVAAIAVRMMEPAKRVGPPKELGS